MSRPVAHLILLAALLCAGAPAAALEYRVEIEAPDEIAASLRKGLNLVRWRDDPEMTPELLRRLATEAERDARDVAATEGYFSPEVAVRIDESRQPWRVRLSLRAGPRTRVAGVDLRLSGPASTDPEAADALERVRASWPLGPGQPFRQEDWDEAKRRAVVELGRWRYAAARVAESAARVDPAARTAQLSVVLESGPPFRFGAIEVRGLQRYPPETVRNMSPIRAGEVYDREQVSLYQRRLMETGYFASVQAIIDDDPAQAQAAPLRVAVIEAPSQRLEAGVSYNTDVGPRLQLRHGNEDLRESAWRLNSELSLDAKIQELQLDLDAPPRPGARWNNYFTRARRTDIQGEITRSFALGVAHNYGTDVAPSAAILSWHVEDQRTETTPRDSRHAVYAGLRRTFRRTDDVVAPRAGYFGNVEIGGGLPGASSQEFLRVTARATWLRPVWRDGELVLRAHAGAVRADAREGIPSEFLFRTGGDQTVRGYAFESIGVAEGGAVIGGRRLVVASAEYTQWFTDDWGAAAFVDAGDAWDDGEAFDAVVGHGLGLRFRTPIGPARADIAYGRETREYRLHISIGYTF